MEASRGLVIVVVSIIAMLIQLSCRQVSRHPATAGLIALAWVMMSQGASTQLSHHYLATLFAMITVWASLSWISVARQGVCWPIIAGLSAGTASMVVATRGGLVMLAAATIFLRPSQAPRTTVQFLTACMIVPLVCAAYVGLKGSTLQAFDGLIVFPFNQYAAIQTVPFGFNANFQNLPLLFAWLTVPCATFVAYRRNWKDKTDNPSMRPCLAFGLAAFVGFLPRMDIEHVAFATPLVCPLLVLTVGRALHESSPIIRGCASFCSALLMLVSLAAFTVECRSALTSDTIPTARGDIILRNPRHNVADLLTWLATAPANDRYFFYPYSPLLPFLSNRTHIGRHDIFTPQYTSAEQYRETCMDVIRSADWIIFETIFFDDPELIRKAFPAITDVSPPETRKFEYVIRSEFALVARFGTFEVRRRRQTTSMVACESIG